MKIAVTATAPDLQAQIDPRFGRCPYFLIVETDDLSFHAVENPNLTLSSGAGIQSAQLLAEHGVKQVLTGNCGPNAHQTLVAAGIDVIVGCLGALREVIEQYKAGNLGTASEANVPGHFGSDPPNGSRAALQPEPTFMGAGGRGRGRGMGGGRGRGMGGGMGRGMRGGMGRGMRRGQGGVFPAGPGAFPAQPVQGLNREDELTALRQQAEEMSRRLQEIQTRIGQLEEK